MACRPHRSRLGASAADDRRRLRALAIGSAGAIAVVGAGFAWVPLAQSNALGLLALLLAGYPLLGAPYFFTGAAVALALRAWPGGAGRVYAADLLGAGAGCVLAVPAMNAVGPPWTAAGCAILALAGARCLAPLGRWAVAGVAAAVVALTAGAVRPDTPNVLPTKPLAVFLNGQRFPGATRELTLWDAVSRVDVFRAPGAQLLWQVGAAGPAPTMPIPRAELPELKGITIDADALTVVARRTPGEPLAVARRLPASVVYEVAPRRHVLVIGPGGGVDVAAALAYGAQRVDAVEVNRALADLMLGPLAAFSGELFHDPAVRLVVDEGRGYLQRSDDRYDAIVLTAVDSWAALAAGAYSLAESYLYTMEAMSAYYDHLAEGGVLAISRWYTSPPREVQRLAQMAHTMLRVRGLPPDEALLLLRAGDFGTLVVRRGAFTEAEMARVQVFANDNGFSVHGGATALSEWTAPSPDGGRNSAGRLPLPPPSTDDRPFFFDFVPWSDVLRGRVTLAALPRGHAVLLLVLVQGMCLGIAAVVVPHRRLPATFARRDRWRLGAYFGAIGAGFMLAEVALLHRLTLLLGYPALSLAVTLAGLLCGAGLGSALWARAGTGRRRAVPAVLGGAALLLALNATVLPLIQPHAIAWPLPARIALALVYLVLPGMAMGPALPAGVDRIAGTGTAAVPWAWGINGAASAIGATLAVMLAMEVGLRVMLLAAAGCY
ncbi:MAG: hypothetical protein ACRDI2_16885, partial [Chloroflexota bacterium]